MEEEKKRLSNVKLFIIILILIIIGIVLWARFISTKGLVVREYAIKSNIITEKMNGLKIIHFSDLLYGRTVNKNDVDNLVEEINNYKPDIVIFTGNLIDKDTIISDSLLDYLEKAMNKINPTIAKYAIAGDQDYNIESYDILMKNAGFKFLDNSYDILYYKDTVPILIIGLPSLLNGEQDYENAFSYLNELDGQNIYKIVAVNEPDTYSMIKVYNPDLVLSGHSLNGQIRIPFVGQIISKKGSKKYYNSFYQIDNTKLYISGGIGTTDYSFRFLNKPSINLYRMYNEA